MFCVHEPLRSRSWPRAAVLALLTVGVAACSGEATRFGDNSNKNNPEATGSISPGQAAPVGRVESRPLPPQTSQLPPPQSGASAPATVAASPGIAGGGRGLASYTPPAATAPHTAYTPVPASTPTSYGPRPATVAPPDVTGSDRAPHPPAPP